jgi:hypothetical protein
MDSVLALLPLVPSCWNDLPEILPFHRMVANKPLRAPIQRRIVVYEAELHDLGAGIVSKTDTMGHTRSATRYLPRFCLS